MRKEQRTSNKTLATEAKAQVWKSYVTGIGCEKSLHKF